MYIYDDMTIEMVKDENAVVWANLVNEWIGMRDTRHIIYIRPYTLVID